MSVWKLLAGPSTGVPTTQLSRAHGVTYSFKVSEPDTCSFDIDGRHPQALDLLELATDVHGTRDGTPLFTGRIGATSDTMDGTKHRTKVSVVDTRGVLGRRLTSVDRTWTGVDAATALTTLWTDAVTDPLGRTPNPANLNITLPAFAATGRTVTRTSKAGQYVLDELSAVAGGLQGAATNFDWDITPGWVGRTVQLWTPYRGRDLTGSVVLTYIYNPANPVSSNVSAFSRSADPKNYANQVRVTGGVKTVKTYVTSTVPGTDTTTTTTTASSTTSSTPVGSVLIVDRGARAVRGNNMTPIPPAVVPAKQVVTEVDVQIPTTPVDLGDGRSAWDIGIYAKSEAYPDIIEQPELAAKATERLTDLQVFTPSYSVKLKQGVWRGPDHIWKGDTVRLIVRSGRIVEDLKLRVTQIDVTVGDDGDEDVTLTVGDAGVAHPLDEIRAAQRAVAELARSSLR